MRKVTGRVAAVLASVALVSSASATAGVRVNLANASASKKSAKPLNVCTDASSCYTSIQAAIDAASDGAMIKIAPGVYQGSLEISKDITLHGAGATQTTINADDSSRVITIAPQVSVRIKGVTVTGGFLLWAPALELPQFPDFFGGGIFNRGSLWLLDSIVSGNHAFSAGGIYNDGTLKLTNSDVSRNGADTAAFLESGVGGGIYNEGGVITLSSSAIRGNGAGSSSGGIFNLRGTITLRDSAVSNNSGFNNTGGIGTYGTMTMYDTTVSGNRSTVSGSSGISNGGALTIYSSSVIGNSALPSGRGGGIGNSGTLTMYDSMVSDNAAFLAGGGIFNRGPLVLRNSTVSRNAVQSYGLGVGGGIANNSTANLYDTTVTGNTADLGAGLFNRDTLTLFGTTVTGNMATCTGGGIYNLATFALFESEISGNTPNDRVDADTNNPPPCI